MAVISSKRQPMLWFYRQCRSGDDFPFPVDLPQDFVETCNRSPVCFHEPFMRLESA